MQRFDSKKDWWLGAMLWVAVLGLGVTAWSAWSAPMPGWQRVLTLSISVAAAVLIVWIWFGTHYEVGGGRLVIRVGPFRRAIELDDITGVTRTRAAWSSPALSLDRLRIDYGDGKSIMVSPERREAFMAALENPELIVRSRRRRRGPRA